MAVCWRKDAGSGFQLFPKGLYVRELAVQDHCPRRVPQVVLCPVLRVEAPLCAALQLISTDWGPVKSET